MLRLAAVSYLNTKPFLKGLQAEFLATELNIRLLPPSHCARAFWSGEVDIALVPAGAMAQQPGEYTLIPDWCIGAEGQVDSVFWVSNTPPQEVSRLYGDPDSFTSNALARLLMQNHWHRPHEWIATEAPQLELLPGEAAVLIGDKAIGLAGRYTQVVDLAAEWQAYTGLPFVFAIWCVQGAALDEKLLRRIHQALGAGFNQLDAVVAEWAPQSGLAPEELLHYYTRSISYRLDESKLRALSRFLDEVAQMLSLDSARFRLPVLQAS